MAAKSPGNARPPGDGGTARIKMGSRAADFSQVLQPGDLAQGNDVVTCGFSKDNRGGYVQKAEEGDRGTRRL